MADIFLSHSSADNDAASRIKSWLERDRKSWSVFLDRHPGDGILGGQSWQDRLHRELRSCRVVLAIITPGWLASHWCFAEAVTATFRGKDFIGIMPIALPGSVLNEAPPIVHERQRLAIDFTNGTGWNELLRALDRSGLDPNRWFPIPEGVCPYPGFVPFEERDAGVFFGRDTEITEYLDALNLLKTPDRAQALVISGSSGSGKSSLLKAGLIPRLRQQPDWLIVPPFDPSREPIHALFAALRTAARLADCDVHLPAKLPTADNTLTNLLQNSLRAIEEKADAWILLPLDQAEGLLVDTREEGKSEGSRLLSAFGQVLASRRRRLVIIVTIRTEFMPRLQLVLPSDVRIRELSLRPISALTDIIEKPAARFGIRLGDGLTNRLVEDTRGPDALPLLAYTLRELYEKHGSDSLLTVAEYLQLDGVEGSIERKLREAMSDPKPTLDEITAFRRCFVRQLVRVDESAAEGERFLRAAVARDEIPEKAQRLIDRLQDMRLLIGRADGTISLAHDRMIRDWPDVQFRTWLDTDSDDRKLILNLKSFLAAYKDAGPLLTAKPLLDAIDLLKRDPALEEDEPELVSFIRASINGEKIRQRRRKWLLAGAFAFLLVAVGAVLLFFEAREQGKVAASQRCQALVAQSEVLSTISRQKTDDEYATLGVLLALEALLVEDDAHCPLFSPEAEAALLYSVFAQREQHILSDHSGGINSVRFSPDGTMLVSASEDRTARIWDAEAGAPIATLEGHEGQVYSAEFSPDGRFILTASSDYTARIWSADGGETIRILRGHEGQVYSASYSPNGQRIITASDDGQAKLWDPGMGSEVVTLSGHNGAIWSAAFSTDGDRVVTASDDKTARIWNAETGELIAILEGHENSVLDASFSPKGEYVVTASWDHTARLWNASSGQMMASLSGHQDGVDRAVFSPDGKWIVTTSADRTVRFWDTNTAKEIAVGAEHAGQIYDASFSKDGRWLVTAADDGTARLWDLAAQDVVATLRGHTGRVWAAYFSPDGQRLATGSEDETARIWRAGADIPFVECGSHRENVRQSVFSPDGRWLATVSDDKTARIWNAETGEEAAVISGHADQVWFAAFSQDGRRLLTTSTDGTARLWDVATGRLIHTLDADFGWVRHGHFSPDGQLVVTGSTGDSDGGNAYVWDAVSGKLLHVLSGHGGPVNFAEFSHDGLRILTASDDTTARLWSAETYKQITILKGHHGEIINAAFSPDDRYVATASWDSTARIWNAVTGEPYATLEDHTDPVWSVAFSPNSDLLITASWDTTARVWDVPSGKLSLVLRGHEGRVTDASFSSDGRLLLTASTDKTARLWHLPSGHPVANLAGHEDSVVSAAFSTDGEHVATASWDHTARLWKLPLRIDEDWIAYASKNLPRILSNEERKRYLGE